MCFVFCAPCSTQYTILRTYAYTLCWGHSRHSDRRHCAYLSVPSSRRFFPLAACFVRYPAGPLRSIYRRLAHPPQQCGPGRCGSRPAPCFVHLDTSGVRGPADLVSTEYGCHRVLVAVFPSSLQETCPPAPGCGGFPPNFLAFRRVWCPASPVSRPCVPASPAKLRFKASCNQALAAALVQLRASLAGGLALFVDLHYPFFCCRSCPVEPVLSACLACCRRCTRTRLPHQRRSPQILLPVSARVDAHSPRARSVSRRPSSPGHSLRACLNR